MPVHVYVSHVCVLLNNACRHRYTQCQQGCLFFWCLICLTSLFCNQKRYYLFIKRALKLSFSCIECLHRFVFVMQNSPELFWMVQKYPETMYEEFTVHMANCMFMHEWHCDFHWRKAVKQQRRQCSKKFWGLRE